MFFVWRWKISSHCFYTFIYRSGSSESSLSYWSRSVLVRKKTTPAAMSRKPATELMAMLTTRGSETYSSQCSPRYHQFSPTRHLHTHTRVKQNTHTLPQLQLIMFSWHLYLFSKEQNNLASWKKHFNSLNKGTITHFVLNYKVFIKLKWYYNTFNLININTS